MFSALLKITPLNKINAIHNINIFILYNMFFLFIVVVYSKLIVNTTYETDSISLQL